MNIENFRSLGLGDMLCRALDELDDNTPTPIQAQAIPQLRRFTPTFLLTPGTLAYAQVVSSVV